MFGVSIRLGPFRQIMFFIVVLGLVCLYKDWFPFNRFHRRTTGLNGLLRASISAAERGGFQVKLANQQSEALKITSKGKTKEGANDPLTSADLNSNYAITQSFIETYGKDTLKIISEEHIYEEFDSSHISFDGYSPNDITNLPSDDEIIDNRDIAIWIDPLDATQEFTENLLQYVTVMVCVAVKGVPTIGVIHKPFEGTTYWAWVGKGKSTNLKSVDKPKNEESALNIIVSRSHSGKVKETAKEAFGSNINVIPAGGSGYKTLEVIAESADAYVHVTMIKKWDICAGNAILNALGGNMTTLTGDDLKYGAQDSELNEGGILATVLNHQIFLNGLKKLREN